MVFLFALSEWLETRAGDKARVAIAAVMSMKPQTACVSEAKPGSADDRFNLRSSCLRA